MQKIGSSTPTANDAGEFTEGNPAAGVEPTRLTAPWHNTVQRELVALVEAGGLEPDPATDDQVLTALRNLLREGASAYALDSGNANAYVANFTPPIKVLTDGMQLRFKARVSNTGPSTFAANGLAGKAIVGLAQVPLQGGEIAATGICTVAYSLSLDKWVLTNCTGGAQQVAPATQAQHAVQLGQAVGRLLSVQIFETAGTFTYTPSSGTKSVVVEVQGAGGGGGAAAANGASLVSAGQGGGGGAYGVSLISSGFSGATITIGAGGLAGTTAAANAGTGGSSSFGGFISCPGGPGGRPGASLPQPVVAQSPLEGAAAPLGANIKAVPGTQPVSGLILTNTPLSGKGGDSMLGVGGQPIYGAAAGNNGTGFGSGGSGGAAGSSVALKAGGAGAGGKVIVWEYS